jgi:hypothetical protein
LELFCQALIQKKQQLLQWIFSTLRLVEILKKPWFKQPRPRVKILKIFGVKTKRISLKPYKRTLLSFQYQKKELSFLMQVKA